MPLSYKRNLGLFFVLLMSLGSVNLYVYAQDNLIQPVYEFTNDGEPTLCDPNDPVLTNLGEFEFFEVDSPFGSEGVALAVEFINEFEQSFLITTETDDLEIASEFLSNSNVCFEAIEAELSNRADAISVPFDGIVRDVFTETSEEYGLLSQEEITELISSGEISNISQLFEEYAGLDTATTLDLLIERTLPIIEDYESTGLLLPDGANILLEDVSVYYDELLDIENQGESLESLFSSEILTPSGTLVTQLQTDPQNIAIQIEWLDISDETRQDFVIFFVIDPEIDQRVSHWYDWKNVTYIEAQISVSRGRVGAYIYNEQYDYLTGTTKTATGESYWISASSTRNESYTLRTYGHRSDNRYTLYGSWRYSEFED